MTTAWLDDTIELLGVEQMYRADAAAKASGVPTLDLMEAAGAAVAERAAALAPAGPIAILCGPGNNGGDGFVAARILAGQGRKVSLALLGNVDRLTGDAAVNAKRWQGEVDPLSPDALDGAALVVDAVFGAGLARALDGVVAATISEINLRQLACIAVDVPSGVDGNTGQILGVAPQSRETVTFFRRKPAHLLYPGRALCGAVRVADIGIPRSVIDEIAPGMSHNRAASWSRLYPWPVAEGHKYARGHVVVAGGDTMTGAARLASYAALRVGAGLVTIFSPPAAGAIYRSGHPGVLVRDIANGEVFEEALNDLRLSTMVVGPGLGVGEATRQCVLAALAANRDCVLDADALSSFAGHSDVLFAAISSSSGAAILTPHEGEFARLFDSIEDLGTGKLQRACNAAREAGAIVLLKGADSVIASPDGRAAINDNAPAWLATAGAGDVLAGFVAGLLAQRMPAFEATCAAVWLHGAAATAFGPGLIAGDLADALPEVLRGLAESAGLNAHA